MSKWFFFLELLDVKRFYDGYGYLIVISLIVELVEYGVVGCEYL